MWKFFWCILLFSSVQLSFAQSSENTDQNKNTLSKIKSAFNCSDIFKLSGYGQALYQLSDNTEINNLMKINRIILFAIGNINPELSYMIMYDFGPKAGLHEYYGEYTPLMALSIRFGQYKIPFTLENPMSPTRWEGIYGSLSVNALAGISTDIIGAKAGRDMGLQLSGKLLQQKDFYLIEYAAGLFNGTGVNTPENNNHKDFAGTVVYQPVKGLKLAGTVYSGKAPYIMDGDDKIKNHVRDRWSVGGEFSNPYWYARSEYLHGNDGGIDRNGFYAVGMWKPIPEKLEIFGKYDYYNPDKDGMSDPIYEHTGGLNYYFGFLSRIQLNYIHTKTGSEVNNTFAIQLQLFF
ncbi:MAG: OprO/OprP family phosphate-selective porin [Dysgonamonadaceae bacterium]|jgi:hypothetical protein|nr:OprO/OprP family phosphate-selective porin [Dysgonamonadaceae bacterium]